MKTTLDLQVNGLKHKVTTDKDRRLLDVLREDLGLTGSKFGCGEGQCGACTVLLDGRAVRSCVTPASRAEGARITTIEGLAPDDASFHPVQQAFINRSALQCGYCTSGMILATVALLERNPNPSQAQVVSALNGNLCRCNGYAGILEAVREAVQLNREGSR